MSNFLSVKEKNKAFVIANFGGPRSLDEIAPFLSSLLSDKDVLRTPLPQPLHTFLFSWIARRRAPKVRSEYEHMGGKSPIFEDTESIAKAIRKQVRGKVLTFHRYLPATHEGFIQEIKNLACDEIRVFPLFPQFTYATTGSIARWFQKYLPHEVVQKIRWIKSYPAHESFVNTQHRVIRNFLEKNGLKEEETILLFSAHGIPKKFIDKGDVYTRECQDSYENVMEHFPNLLGRLSYQSKFGPGEWVRPYTIDVCNEIHSWYQGRKNVVFVPISFTSDHIETLCEIENDYMTVIRDQGLKAYRVPAINVDPEWVDAIVNIMNQEQLTSNQMLVYRRRV